jgi:hypothetical protein
MDELRLAGSVSMRVVFITALFVLVLVARRSTRTHDLAPRYFVTAAPLDVGVGRRGLCVAVDPTDPRGVWWWEPGRSGCSSRSTGPGVFQGDDASVATHRRSSWIDAHFRLPLIGRPDLTIPNFANVNLTLQAGYMRSVPSGGPVSLELRGDLEVPERP